MPQMHYDNTTKAKRQSENRKKRQLRTQTVKINPAKETNREEDYFRSNEKKERKLLPCHRSFDAVDCEYLESNRRLSFGVISCFSSHFDIFDVFGMCM